MIDVVSTSFYIKVSDFTKADFELYSSELFDEWEKHVAETLNLSDYSLTLVVEEGSIKGKGRVAATLVALYFGIGEYGDFISGLKTIQEQAAYVTHALFAEAKNTFQCSGAAGHSRRNADALSYLKGLFNQVQHGQLTPEQAMDRVKARFGDEANTAPGFMRDLESSLSIAPRDPEQLTLVDSSWTECEEMETSAPGREPKLPNPSPTPISHHYRIEISRESRMDKKKMKVTKIK